MTAAVLYLLACLCMLDAILLGIWDHIVLEPGDAARWGALGVEALLFTLGGVLMIGAEMLA